jgi:hypothetical protein
MLRIKEYREESERQKNEGKGLIEREVPSPQTFPKQDRSGLVLLDLGTVHWNATE